MFKTKLKILTIIFLSMLIVLATNNTYAMTTEELKTKFGETSMGGFSKLNDGTNISININTNPNEISLLSTSFYTNPNMFCMNKGWSSPARMTFDDIDFYSIINGKLYYYDGKTHNEAQIGAIKPETSIEIKEVYNKMSYVLSEIEGGKTSIRKSKYQIALWFVFGSTTSSGILEEYYEAAKPIYANSIAYDRMVKNNTIDKAPTINTTEAEIKQTNGKTLLGPISIKYNGTKITTSIEGSNVNGYYGEILGMKLVAGATTSQISENQIVDANGNKLSASNTLKGYPASGYKFYIDITRKESDTYKVKVELNNQYRDSIFYILDSSNVLDTDADGTVVKQVQNVLLGKGKKTTKEYTSQTVNPSISLGGTVWLDGQTGVKVVEAPNGIYDEQTGITGIKVRLYKENGTFVAETKTENGKYEFKNIPKARYYITFEYDGINYIQARYYKNNNNVNNSNEYLASKAQENSTNRSQFNNKFTTITSKLGLEYDTYLKENNKYISVLKTTTDYDTVNHKNGVEVMNPYKMIAATEIYDNNNTNINFGLLNRNLDLSLGTNVEKATINVNGTSTNIKYDDILANNGVLNPSEIFGENISAQKTYTLDLYQSDYNFNIDDYTLNEEMGLDLTDENVKDSLNKAFSQLTIDVTYKIVLNNQGASNAKINEIIDYYDANYTYKSSSYEKYSVDGNTKNDGMKVEVQDGTVTIDGKEYKKLKITGLDKVNLNGAEQNIIYITFSVNGIGNAIKLGEYSNIAEIVSYSTQEGLVDKDSAVNNCIDNSKLRYEDDTDKAGSLKIEISDNTREISGLVWDDSEKNENNAYKFADGIYQDGNKLINDITVQLIEIKEIELLGEKYKLEYIWSETTTGGNIVKTINPAGTELQTEEVKAENGKYKFQDFLPGTYIIRFKYGNTQTDTMLKYNGADYKSTTDKNYTDELYDEAKYQANASVARDNEARRLEVMANMAYLDSALNIEETWMCAETSKIDANKEYGQIKYNKVNFGLEQRPSATIELEKHLTALKIVTVAGNTLIDAIAQDWSNTANIQGLRDNLFAIVSTKSTQGVWKLETDIEEVIQGAKLQAVYEYKVTNKSEDNYISKILVDEYMKNPAGYAKYLEELAKQVKQDKNHKIGTYVGETYYNANKNAKDVVATNVVRVEEIKEAIANDMTCEIGTYNTQFKKVNQNPEVCKILSGGAEEEITINNIIATAEPTKVLKANDTFTYKLILTKTLSSTGNLVFPNYIAQVTAITTPDARKDNNSSPNNQKYILTDRPIENDEAWGEKITITKNTGEEEKTQWTVIVISITVAIAIVVVGAIVIKKTIIK